MSVCACVHAMLYGNAAPPVDRHPAVNTIAKLSSWSSTTPCPALPLPPAHHLLRWSPLPLPSGPGFRLPLCSSFMAFQLHKTTLATDLGCNLRREEVSVRVCMHESEGGWGGK